MIRRWFFGLVAKRLPEEEILASYIKPLRSNAAVRADVTKAMSGASAKYTLAAARKFGEFNAPPTASTSTLGSKYLSGSSGP
jgi:hypothetical protein